jgi:hypothetical protein
MDSFETQRDGSDWVGTLTVTTHGPTGAYHTTKERWATSTWPPRGLRHGTSRDFFMATDTSWTLITKTVTRRIAPNDRFTRVMGPLKPQSGRREVGCVDLMEIWWA